jgi:hypothetical protein
MSTTIQLKRGLKTNLPTLAAGEMALTTDEGLVYIGCGGQNIVIGSTVSGNVDPSTPRSAGLLYINTTTSGMFFSTGSEWIPVGTGNLSEMLGTLDDIQDGLLFQKVAATEVDASGYVIKINDGVHSVTAEQARDHIDDAARHRQINDSGSSNIDLWSAQKILDQLGAAIRGVDWQSSVLTISGVPPNSPLGGDRYLIAVAPSGIWATYDNYITEWVSTSGTWVMTQPDEGFATWVSDVDKLYLYTGTDWTPISSVTYHNYLAGLDGGAGGSYYHLSAADYTALTTNRTQTVKSIVGPMASGTQTFITVSYNEPLGVFDFVVSVPHSATTGQTANDHHAEQHSLISSSQHTVATVSGYVLKATSSNTVGMEPITLEMLPSINHSNLAGVTADQHHAQVHDFFTTNHTFSSVTMVSGNLIGAISPSAIGVFDMIDGGLF